jgi:catalase
VPGIAISPDKMLQARVFSYHDTHIHRLGPNYLLIPINATKHAAENSYQGDGFMQTGHNEGGGPDYWPDSFGGPEPAPQASESPFEIEGRAGHYPYQHSDDDFVHAGNRYRKVVSHQDRQSLIGNIVDHLGSAQKRFQLRQAAIFYKAEPDYGRRITGGLGLDVADVERLANISQEERAKATAL